MSIKGEHADGHPVYARLELPASELIAEHQGHGMPATYFGDCEQCHAQMPHEHTASA